MEALLPFFKTNEIFDSWKLEDKVIMDIIATSTYENFKKGKTVIKHGDIGDKFYLILFG
jgi:hypothetical protein